MTQPRNSQLSLAAGELPAKRQCASLGVDAVARERFAPYIGQLLPPRLYTEMYALFPEQADRKILANLIFKHNENADIT